MQCARFREAISARLDDEPLGMSGAEIDDHLDGCPASDAWARDAARVTRRARLAPSPAIPDLTAAILSELPRELPGTAAAARTRVIHSTLRMVLAAVGVAQAGLAWPALVSGSGAMSAPVHMAHESGAWNLAVAAAFLAVATWPGLAAGALPFLGSFVALLVPVTVADLLAGHVHADRAVAHGLLVVGTLLVVTLAWRTSTWRRSAGRGSTWRRTARAAGSRRVAA
jgi:predicted anti-sigma-YlaC factor YlaD